VKKTVQNVQTKIQGKEAAVNTTAENCNMKTQKPTNLVREQSDSEEKIPEITHLI
jgi:hypothetical protein